MAITVELRTNQGDYHPAIMFKVHRDNGVISVTTTGNVNIDWGDGTNENVNTAQVFHTYTTAGDYKITMSNVLNLSVIEFSAGREDITFYHLINMPLIIATAFEVKIKRLG
jgi:hypothetical protein